jgi:hypothetical protein
MTLVFNALARGFEHVPFDAALLASVAEAFPGESIRFYAEPDHLWQTRAYLADRAPAVAAHITWTELALPPRPLLAWGRWLGDLRITRFLLGEARRFGARRVLAAYMDATAGFAAFKLLGKVYRPPAFAYVHHGNLLRTFSSRRYHPLLAWANGHLRQIVLGDFIRDTILETLPRLASGLHSVRLPCLFDPCDPSDWPVGPVTFSYLGIADLLKNFPGFVQLAGEIVPAFGASVKFDLIGGTRSGAVEGAGPHVTTYVEAGPVPRALFERQLHQTTYAVFPYHQQFYRVIASASVLDAVGAGKPLIVLRNPQFEELFEVMGDIGYLCDSMTEMTALVASIVREPPRERYHQQSLNILARRGVYAPDAVGAQLKRIFGSIATQPAF